MRRLTAILLMLMCLCFVEAQTSSQQKAHRDTARDYKASLDLWTSLASFAVSPSGEIWLSDNYDVWHTNGMSSNWKRMLRPRGHCLRDVVCPDTNTVLIFGEISDPSDTGSHHDKYLRSTDGGKTWDYLPLSYQVKRDHLWTLGRDSGQVWLCVDSVMYYSSDKGLHFQEIARIPDHDFRFDMDDNGRDGMGRLNWEDSEGISRHSLVMTRDNWAHYEKIPTPYDQHLGIKSNYFYSLSICGSRLVLEQDDRYFWTSIDTICWREIPLNIRDFAVDRENDEWVIVTRENQLLRSADLVTFDTVNTNGPCYLTVIKHADSQTVYGFSYNDNMKSARRDHIDSLYRISADGLTTYGLYTEDIPLGPNRYCPVGDEDGNINELEAYGTRVALASPYDLILFDQRNQKWYRHLKTTFPIKEVRVDTNELKGSLLLSDGARLYLAKIDTPEITPFRYERPLDEFLKSPVESVDIVYKFFPCVGQRYSERVLYHLEGNDFVIKKLSLEKKGAEFTHTFSAKQLRKELKALNTGYDASVRVSDFGFTQDDYDSIRSLVFLNAKHGADLTIWCDSATNERVLEVLPQLGDSIWTEIIQSYPDGGCTSFSTFEITFQNKDGKTLVVSCTDNSCNYDYYPYKTPFQIQCDGRTFPATSLSFMRFVGEITPTSMQDRSFSKFTLLMKAYRYVLWHREEFGI